MGREVIALLAVAGCHGDAGDGRPPPTGGPPTLIASSSDEVEVRYPDLAFAPDGTLWVSWVELHADDTADVLVVRSDDGGRTFSGKILADDVDQLFLGSVRQPVLAADADRVAIAVGGGSYASRNTILLFVAPAARPEFETQVIAEGVYTPDPQADPATISLVDQPELMFDRDGDLWVDWKQGTFNESFRLVVARERAGFAHEVLDDGVRGQPCECCPTDFLQYPDGEVLLAFRNNEANLREIWIGSAPDGEAFTEFHQVSTTGWFVPGCPLDGPSVTLAGEALVATWADASEGDNHQWMAVSYDRGRVWTPSFRVEPDNGERVTWPQVVTAVDGTVWTSAQEIQHRTSLRSTADLGRTFTPHGADAPTGPVFSPEIAAAPDGGVGLVGITEAGELWYLAVSE